ncbi:hypothetical protein QUF54_01460 [Candidatus Marithioploca araucensis]|uniref:Uncharacterized protein n=1 Tax=Candidatus Marithioploca araucensis TaxID=70273 RepID=A0ABT7VSH3_9GAMM|nr:hypothetical protein [Candidatus Marithioploca araucensis]
MIVIEVFSLLEQIIHHPHQLHIDNLVIDEQDKLAIVWLGDWLENCTSQTPKSQVYCHPLHLRLHSVHDLDE